MTAAAASSRPAWNWPRRPAGELTRPNAGPTKKAGASPSWKPSSEPTESNHPLEGPIMALQSVIAGKAYVLGDNIDTDQIIPAQYLTFNPAIPKEYRQFGKYALSSVPPAQSGLPKGRVPFHTKDEFVSDYAVIIGGRNFGCGSSREHAPVALAAAGI